MNEETEILNFDLPLEPFEQLLNEKTAALQVHIDDRIARLEGMLLMAARTVTPVQAAPAQPAAPTTQVPVNTLPPQVPLYSIQNGAYAGWWCYYTPDRRSHPVLSREQAPAWDNLFGTRGNNPVMPRDQVQSWEAYNAPQIMYMKEKAREWAQSQAPIAQAPTPAPAVPEFNDNIPDFA